MRRTKGRNAVHIINASASEMRLTASANARAQALAFATAERDDEIAPTSGTSVKMVMRESRS